MYMSKESPAEMIKELALFASFLAPNHLLFVIVVVLFLSSPLPNVGGLLILRHGTPNQ